MSEELVSLTQYARMHGLSRDTVVQRAKRGSYKTARKIGHVYVIDANEPHIDNRFKTGAKIGRKRKIEYLCRDADGNERYLTSEEFKQSTDWKKVYRFQKNNEKAKMTLQEAAELGGWERTDKSPVSRLVDIK